MKKLILVFISFLLFGESIFAQEKTSQIKIIEKNEHEIIIDTIISNSTQVDIQKIIQETIDINISELESDTEKRVRVIVHSKDGQFKQNIDTSFLKFHFDENDLEDIDKDKIIELLNHDKNLMALEKETDIIMLKLHKHVSLEKLNESDLDKIGAKNDLDPSTIKFVKVFPNPTKGTFQINFKSESKDPVDIVIYDISGKSIYKKSITDFNGDFNQTITLPEQEGNQFYLNILQNNNRYMRKVIIEEN